MNELLADLKQMQAHNTKQEAMVSEMIEHMRKQNSEITAVQRRMMWTSTIRFGVITGLCLGMALAYWELQVRSDEREKMFRELEQ